MSGLQTICHAQNITTVLRLKKYSVAMEIMCVSSVTDVKAALVGDILESELRTLGIRRKTHF